MGLGIQLVIISMSNVKEAHCVYCYSYPNIIPLPASEVERIRDTIKAYTFERLYGAWFDRIVAVDAHNAVLRSADRYIQAVQRRLEP
jgi:hypothetical protein